MNVSQLRVVARIARRNARRNTLRSALAVAMVGLPVALVVAGASVVRTVIPNPEEEAASVMGSADLLLVSPGNQITRNTLRERLPPDSHVLMIRREDESVVRDGELFEISFLHLDEGLQSPQVRGFYDLESGQEPIHEGEVALHPEILDSFDSRIGGQIELSGRTLSITGIVRASQDFDRLVAITGSDTLSDDAPVSEVLINFGTGNPNASFSSKLAGNAEAVIPRSEILEASRERAASSDTLAVALGVVALVCIGLVAAAAFIVGAHRQLRGLGVLLAAGGEPRHVRAVVLLAGTTLGILGSLIGVAFGLVIARSAYPFLDELSGRSTGPFETSRLVVIGSFTMGIIAATLAAYAPARMAGKLTVAEALASRTPSPKPPGNLAGFGIIMFVIGGFTTAWSMASRQAVIIAVGLSIMLLGIFLVIPILVTAQGRLASLLPISGRQAARDAARHGRRTSAAIAAAIISLSIPISVAAWSLGEENHERRTQRLGENQLIVGRPGGVGLSSFRDLHTDVTEAFPHVLMVPLSTAESRSETELSETRSVGAYGIRSDSEPDTVRSADLFVGDADLLEAMRAQGGAQALASGKAVVLQGYEPVDGIVKMDVPGTNRSRNIGAVSVESPAFDNESIPSIVISPATMKELRLRKVTDEYLVAGQTAFSTEDVRAAKEIAASYPGFYVTSAEDYLPRFDLLRTFSTLASIPLALAVLAVVVALVVSESQRSHQILVAVGAGPTMHRKMVAATSGLLALISSVLAIPAGLVPVWAVQVGSQAGRPLAVPWLTIGIVLVVTPVLSSVVAGIVSRAPKLGSLLRLAD